MTNRELIEANRRLRASDDSHLWPIRGRFNVTERAIRRVRRYMREYGPMSYFELRGMGRTRNL